MKRQPIKVLLVEDEISYAETVRAVLAEATTSEFLVEHVATLKHGLNQLASGKFDVVLLDLTLPDANGLTTYARIHEKSPATPVIVLTGLDDQTLALTAVREGAQDYLVKGQVDARMLVRVIHYAIERKTAAQALRESEEFFRLISENVSDLIAVLDPRGRRLYNSPSYKTLLGEPDLLCGTDSFSEIHPEDQEMVRETFHRTVETGVGHRIAYRLLLKDQSVRFIESQGNAIKDHAGQTRKVVVVSRDMTEHKESETVLRTALADLKKSHEELKGAQIQLVQSEKLEAVSTFAAGVAHEVKNPLQTIILGVDYLSKHLGQGPTSAIVLNDMAAAVHRADSIIRGLIEFSANGKREIKDENLTQIVEQSLQSVDHELKTVPIALLKELAPNLPVVKLDFRTMKHVFINLFMYCIRAMETGGTLRVRTFSFEVKEAYLVQGRVSKHLKIGDTVVVAEVEDTAPPRADKIAAATATGKGAALGLSVLKKIVELYGGLIDFHTGHGHKYTISFKANPGG
jgi:PAS domain S-box-containing protein